MKAHIFRLKSGSKLRQSIQEYAKKKNLSAAIIISTVGAFSKVNLRMAGATPKSQDVREYKGDFEIVSIEGTLSAEDCHIHVAISGKEGKVIGGHLKEGVVAVTAEIALLQFTDRKFLRKLDKQTGFEELEVEY